MENLFVTKSPGGGTGEKVTNLEHLFKSAHMYAATVPSLSRYLMNTFLQVSQTQKDFAFIVEQPRKIHSFFCSFCGSIFDAGENCSISLRSLRKKKNQNKDSTDSEETDTETQSIEKTVSINQNAGNNKIRKARFLVDSNDGVQKRKRKFRKNVVLYKCFECQGETEFYGTRVHTNKIQKRKNKGKNIPKEEKQKQKQKQKQQQKQKPKGKGKEKEKSKGPTPILSKVTKSTSKSSKPSQPPISAPDTPSRNVLRKKTQGGVLQKLLKKAEIEKKKESNEGLSLSDFLKSM